jgi:hypothetical protein
MKRIILVIALVFVTGCSTTLHVRVESNACIERKEWKMFGVPMSTTESRHDPKLCHR